jgi:hypothetical protein
MEDGENVNQEWLKTPDGRAWLESDDGMQWFNSTEGRWWSQGEDAGKWYAELAQDGWATYFAGKGWPLPEGFITPETAPKIASRVRINFAGPTFKGDVFEVGEVAVVAALQFNPIGSVSVELRTVDGRKCIALRPEDYLPV